MQRTMIFLMALLLLATACSGGENSEQRVPTLLPTVMEEEDAAEESPRVETTLDARVPPTWTPSSSRPGSSAPLPTGTVASPVAGAEGGQAVEDGKVYVVQAGDTLAELAEDFGVELELLAEANNIADIDHIEVGQELVIPGGVATE